MLEGQQRPGPELIVDCGCALAECPVWHPGEQRLYWVDIPTGTIYRLDPATGVRQQFETGTPIGGFTVQADGALLLFMARAALALWSEGELRPLRGETPGEQDSRFNDVIADPRGRVYCGTMPTSTRGGRLYRLDPDGSLTRLLDDIGIPNGMGFTPDHQQMYLTDSLAGRISLFDYDEESGEISNQRLFIQIPRERGVPDGLTVDSDGYVWSARWDGAALLRYSPQGTVDQRVSFPAKKISSLTFGGPGLSDIYVTSAGGRNKAKEGAGAGGLFRLDLGIRGVPDFQSRIAL